MQLFWVFVIGASLLTLLFMRGRGPGRRARRRGIILEPADRQNHRDQADRDLGVSPAGVRREAADGRVTERRRDNPPADLAPEDAYGEDRPANRTIPPDQPPTQWHPREHGVPGDHYRGGHHRSATGPERQSGATDRFAHAPVPGPAHLPPEDGVDLPEDARP